MIHQRRMQELLQSFLDGELPAARRAALVKHLQRCPACAVFLRQLAESDQRLLAARSVPQPLSPPDALRLQDRILAEVGAPGTTAASWHPATEAMATRAQSPPGIMDLSRGRP